MEVEYSKKKFAQVFEKQFICLEHYIETIEHNHIVQVQT